MVDYYTQLDNSFNTSTSTLKEALMKCRRLAKAPLSLAKHFTDNKQGNDEHVVEFTMALTKLFKEAFLTRN